MKARFAPSPTGYIHVGNCRTLLINWLFTKEKGGTFLLRLDDTDQERSEKKYEDGLLEDLKWLGLDYDMYEKQSDRMGRYNEIAEILKEEGRLYACYETSEELEFKRKRQAAQSLPPLYDREGLTLTSEQKKSYEAKGRKPHWRFLLKEEAIEWNDMVRGPLHFEGKNLSDPVLIREDGLPLYTLASVVDDMDMKITHIIRGEDHISNTAVQMQLWEALGHKKESITFGHLSLLQGAEGNQLSKRLGTESIRDLRQQGILPMAVNSLLAKIGTSDSMHPFQTLESLIESFDIKKFSRSTPKFSSKELLGVNEKLIHSMSYEDVKKQTDFPHLERSFWEAIRPNLTSLSDLPNWWTICRENVSTQVAPEDREFIHQAKESLPASWAENPWETWISHLKETTDRKGKTLFMPLRQALTGQNHGPELKTILFLMGPDLAHKRLEGALSK
ncbi:glutamate--tRNA ligase [Alphaproteobacteria bacterium]|nr:glutamate--tRNA ligase [Alphaproteobacteria bacterium]